MDEQQTELAAYLADRDVPCPGCGYNLRSVTSPVCPECGQRIVMDELIAGLHPRSWVVPFVITGLVMLSLPLPWCAIHWLAPAWTKTDAQWGAFAMLGALFCGAVSLGVGGPSLMLLWVQPRDIGPFCGLRRTLTIGILGCSAVIALNSLAALSVALE